MNAIYTNVVTDILAASVSFCCFCLTVYHYSMRDKRYTGFIISFFFMSFLLFSMGASAHYFAETHHEKILWQSIAMGIILLTYFTIHAVNMSAVIRSLLMIVSVVLILWYLIDGNFLWIALLQFIIYATVAIYTRRLARLGFLLVIMANVSWFIMRKIMMMLFGNPVPISVTYHNDIYHVLLIIAICIIYRSIAKGDWVFTK